MTRRIFCKVLLVVVAIFGLLVLSGVLMAQGRSQDAFDRVREVQEGNTNWLMAMEGVEGTAIGFNQNDQLAIKVFTAGPGVRGIPQELEDVPVQVVVTGKFYALSTTDRLDRPVPIGVSTGHPDITAGTIGCRVIDANGNVYALSNNHVYANSNEASLGDAVIQPGTADGGSSPDDDIGTLADFEPIVFGPRGTNTIDAAIALTSTDMVGTATPTDGYGIPKSTTLPADDDLLGKLVQKYGRTTGLTKGVVDSVSGNFRVHYSSGFAIFVEQIVITPGTFSDGGDSGSLIVTQDGNESVGLLFAGSSSSTIANPIDLVLERFGVTVDDAAGVSVATGSIAGKVTDADTKDPISGATVTADPGGYSTTTAGDGTYTLAYLPVGSYTLTASATGYTDESKTDDVLEDQTTTVDFALKPVAEPTTGSIEGTVTNVSDGTAIEGAAVSVDTGQSATTDEFGWYSIAGVPTGERSVAASADGFESETITATVYENFPTTVDFALNPVTTVGNVFVILPSGTDGYATEGGRDGKKHLLITVALEDDLYNPVAGASVSIDLFLGGSPYTSGTGTTGTDGTVTFKVANAPSGYYTTEVTYVFAEGLTWDGLTPENEYDKQ